MWAQSLVNLAHVSGAALIKQLYETPRSLSLYPFMSVNVYLYLHPIFVKSFVVSTASVV
jgi:hypothetical protein